MPSKSGGTTIANVRVRRARTARQRRRNASCRVGAGNGHASAGVSVVEDQIAMLLHGLPPSFGASNVVDLGCGVGASLCYLAARLPVRGTGITLSPIQARFAKQRIRKSGFADRIRCIEGDYCDIPAAPARRTWHMRSNLSRMSSGSLPLLRTMSRPDSTGRVAPDLRRLPATDQ